MDTAPRIGWRGKFQSIIKWLFVILMGLSLIVVLALCLVLSFPDRLLPIANSELDKALPGALSIDRISKITWNGATGVDLTLRDSKGDIIVRAFDVSVKTSWQQLMSELLSNDPTLNIAADSITLRAVHVDLGTTTDGELRLVRALVSSEPSETPSSSSVQLEFRKIRIVHAWVYGDVDGSPLDAHLTELTTTLSLDDTSLELPRLTTQAQVRAPQVYASPIQVNGHCEILFPEDDVSLNAEATLISEGATIEAMFSLKGDEIETHATGTVPPSLTTQLVPRTSQATEIIASAQGTPADFTSQLTLQHGGSKLHVDAHIQRSDSLKLNGRIRLNEFDGSLFDLPELAALDADLKLSAERSDVPEPELDRWKATVEGSVRRVQIQEADLPPLSLQAQYDDRVVRAWVEEQETASPSRVEATALLFPSGIKTLHTTGSVRAELLSAYLTEFKAKGDVSFDAELTGDMKTIEANLSGNLRNVRASEALRADQLSFIGDVSGRLSDPSTNLNVQVRQAHLKGRRFKEMDVDLHGTLSSSKVRARAILEGQKIAAAATVGLDAGNLRIAGGSLSVSDGENRSSISTESVRVRGDQVQFSHLRLEGLGTSDLSGHWSPKSVKLNGYVRGVQLQKLAALASVNLPLGGIVNLDADISVDRGTSTGHMLLAVADLKFKDGVLTRDLPKADTKLEIVGEGRHLIGDLDATVPGSADVEQTSEVKLRARISTPAVWDRLPSGSIEEQFVSIEGRVAFNAQHISQFVDEKIEAEGRIVGEFEATSEQSYSIPKFDAQLTTRQLALTIPAPDSGPDGKISLTRIEDFDFKITAHHNPVTGKSESRIEVIEGGSQMGWAEAHLEAPLTPLLGGQGEPLSSAPLSIRLAFPSFRVEKLPQPIRPQGVVGTIGLRVDVDGSMGHPSFKTEATFKNLGPDALLDEESLRLSGRASAEYDTRSLVWNASARSPQGAKVESTGQLEAPWDAAKFRPLPDELSSELSIKSLPLRSFQSLTQQQIDGTVDLLLSVNHWGTPQERVDAKIKFVDLEVDGVAAQGRVSAQLEENHVHGSLLLSGNGYSVEGTGEVAVLREGMWGLKLGDTRRASLQARKVPLVIFRSLVGSQVAGISGNLNLNLKAESVAERATITADFKLQDGALQIPSLGQQFRDIDLQGKWRDGKIVVDKASFRGISGRGTLKAKAEMKNLTPISAAVHLKVERNRRIPVSLLGMGIGELWGEIHTDWNFDHDERRITGSTRFSSFHLWFPELPTNSIQSLTPAEQVKVGVVVGSDEFVPVPLQPVKKQDKTPNPWTLDAKFDLGDEFWLQQGPSRRIQVTGSAQIEMVEEVRVHGKLGLARGTFELNGRAFEVHRGTITFQPDEPDNPLILLDARWYSPEGITVIATFTGPAKTGTLSLTSDPPLREDQVVSLLLFGDTSGLGEGAASGDSDSATQAAVVGGSLASSGLNQALGRVKGVDLKTRVRGEGGNVRPEVVVQLTNSLSAQLGYNLEEPGPGKSPDRTLLTFEARLVGGSSVSATIGDQGSSIVNWVWRYRY